jgi:hypothetical protein
MVELGFVLPIFLVLTMGIFEFGRLYYIELTLQTAVREASRFTITGAVLPDPDNPGEFLSRIDSIVLKVAQAAPGLGVDPTHVTITGPDGPGDPGGPGDLVTIQLDYDIDPVTPIVGSMFPGGVYHVSISLISRNELFPEA